MIDPNIPDEEMNFDFGIDDIVKSTTEAAETITSDNGSGETNQEEVNFLDEVKEAVEEVVEPTSETLEEAPTTDIEPAYEPGVYETALEFMKENGLLNIPDDVNEINDQTWNQILDYNREYQKQSILNELRMNADPRVTELFDYVYNGGTWYGFEEMKDTIQSEINIEELNTTDEQDQRYLIESFLTEGLDPSNPAHALRLKNVNNEVDIIFDRLEQEEMATQAKEYYLDKVAQQKQILAQQQEQHRQQQLYEQQLAQQQRQQWVNDFQNTLNSRNWAQTKKDAVVSQFDVVQLDDGREMEMWKYKFDAIWDKPELTQVFLDFLSDLDPYSLEFKRNGVPSNKQVTSTIQNLINSKTQHKAKGQSGGKRRVETVRPTIDPRNL